jgi:hypothetical protein
VSISTAYPPQQEILLRVLAFVSRHSESVAQRDATLRLVRLLDRGSATSRASAPRTSEWFRGTVTVTSTYTAAQAAGVERVARRLHVTPSMVQRLAVTLGVFLLVIRH